MTTTDCLPRMRFDFHPERTVDVSIDAPTTSSDGGLVSSFPVLEASSSGAPSGLTRAKVVSARSCRVVFRRNGVRHFLHSMLRLTRPQAMSAQTGQMNLHFDSSFFFGLGVSTAAPPATKVLTIA